MENSLLYPITSLIFLLSISSISYIIAQKIKFPYTVFLVLVGLLLVPFIDMWYLWFIRWFQLTPDMLFYIFLPILIYESAYNINYKDILKSRFSIFWLSVIGLMISMFAIALGMYFLFPLFGFHLPFLVCLLFWSLISATDTVAVLTLFKSIWAPKRLVTIFEGESLFNDGTALALFFVILWVITEGKHINFQEISLWILTFGSMFVWGILFWLLTGYFFSRIIGKIKNNDSIEIILTMVLAHLTFILAHLIWEHVFIAGFPLQISWVIATTVAAIVMGNYGRYKISPKISRFMERFWWVIAFVANSLVFILLGLIVYDIKIQFFPGFFTILFVTFLLWILSRSLWVILPIWVINFFKLEQPILLDWQKVLAWWAPRGAISFIMILLIPDTLTLSNWWYDFSIKEFLTLLTISMIMLSLFIKVPTIPSLMKKLKLDKLSKLEKIEREHSKIIMFTKNCEKIESSYKRGVISKEEYQKLEENFHNTIETTQKSIQQLQKNEPQIIERYLSIYALGVQKNYLIELLTYNEIDEHNFKHLINRIEHMTKKYIMKEKYILDFDDDYIPNIFEKITDIVWEHNPTDIYVKKRSLRISLWKVLKELKELKKIDFWYEGSVFDDIINRVNIQYKLLRDYSFEASKSFQTIENKLFEKSILKTSEMTISELKHKWVMTDKLYHVLGNRLEEEIQS